MTAFARREVRADWGKLTWELRSVNHRYLEVSPRLPEDLRALEGQVRERVSARLGRGKIDCVLRLKLEPGAAATAIKLNRDFAEQLKTTYQELAQLWGQKGDADLSQLLRWPGVIEETEMDVTPVAEAALVSLGECLDDLVATREREGGKLAAMILERCDAIDGLVVAIRQDLPAIHKALRERVLKKIEDLGVEVETGRLEQELAVLAQKMDAAEELDRLGAHVEETRHTLALEEPVGRRLDFLMQELNREANTLAAKSSDLDTTKAGVDLKVLVEQMREQVQNIE
jgi:uncharacterized protein (TIGR00255 family)